MRVVPESGNLFRLTRLGMVNCFLVREADGLTLMDANLPGSARQIASAVKELGAPIRRILLTHAHFDHVGSVDGLFALVPGLELLIGKRESRLLAGDRSLDRGESGKTLFGFRRVSASPSHLLQEGDSVGSLQAIASPGHTPGHFSYLDTRDGTLLAGDAITTQIDVVVAGAFIPKFPMASLFCWNRMLAAESGRKLCALKPELLATGHGKTIRNPASRMERALELALRQSRKMLD